MRQTARGERYARDNIRCRSGVVTLPNSLTDLLKPLLLALALLISLPGTAQAQSTSEPVQTESQIEVGDGAPTDAEIATRIGRLLDEIEAMRMSRCASAKAWCA